MQINNIYTHKYICICVLADVSYVYMYTPNLHFHSWSPYTESPLHDEHGVLLQWKSWSIKHITIAFVSCRSTLKTTLSHGYRNPWSFKRRCGRGWSLRRCTCIGLCRGPDTAVADSRHWYVALVCGYGGWPLSVLNCTERRWPHRMARILHLDMYLNSICFMSQFQHQFEEPLTLITFCRVWTARAATRVVCVVHQCATSYTAKHNRFLPPYKQHLAQQSRTTYTNTNYETRSFIP